MFYSLLWLIAAIIATVYGTQWDMSTLKGAAVSTIDIYIMASSLNKSMYVVYPQQGKLV